MPVGKTARRATVFRAEGSPNQSREYPRLDYTLAQVGTEPPWQNSEKTCTLEFSSRTR